MELTIESRLILRNQYRLLKHLDPDAADEAEQAITILENGFESEYWRLTGTFGSTLSVEDGHEVSDILQMFRELRWSYADVGDESGVDENRIAFLGFDGNYETKQLLLAKFLIGQEGHWDELKGAGDHLNSHWPVIDTYRRMLAVWKPIAERRRGKVAAPDRPLLSADDIRAIADAAIHPENR